MKNNASPVVSRHYRPDEDRCLDALKLLATSRARVLDIEDDEPTQIKKAAVDQDDGANDPKGSRHDRARVSISEDAT